MVSVLNLTWLIVGNDWLGLKTSSNILVYLILQLFITSSQFIVELWGYVWRENRFERRYLFLGRNKKKFSIYFLVLDAWILHAHHQMLVQLVAFARSVIKHGPSEVIHICQLRSSGMAWSSIVTFCFMVESRQFFPSGNFSFGKR